MDICFLCLFFWCFALFCFAAAVGSFVFWYIRVFYLIIFCLIIHALEACCFLTRDRMQVGLDGRGGGKEVGGVEGEENIIRIYCMRKCLFSIKGEKDFKKEKTRPTVLSTTKCYRANST